MTRRRYIAAAAGGGFSTISDDFNRVDNASTMGSTSVGAKPWTAVAGTWGILSNTAYLSSVVGDDHAVVDAGVADCTISVTIANAATVQGIYFRVTDANNGWRFGYNSGQLYLQKNIAGTRTTLVGPVGGPPAVGDVLSVVLSGSSIIAKVNGATITGGSITDSQWATVTKHGIGGIGSLATADRFDTFSITVP